MKNIINIILLFGLVTIGSCAKKIYTTPNELSGLVNNSEFTFVAERANPTNGDVLNVMNSIPGGGAQRFLDLDYGYFLTFKDNKLTVDLPYFGRLYTPSFDTSKNSLNFTTSDFTIDKSQNKKGNYIYNIVARDKAKQFDFNLEIFANGKSYLNVFGTDRQSISYNGYVMKNLEKKE